MGLFFKYKITDRRTRKVYHQTQALSLFPILISCIIFVPAGAAYQPSLWAAVGVILATQMILSGAYRLHVTHDLLSPLGRRLADTSDDWFPFLLFVVQNVCIMTITLVLWFAMKLLGLPISKAMTANVTVLIILIPTRLIFQELAVVRNSAFWDHLKTLLNYPIICLLYTSDAADE